MPPPSGSKEPIPAAETLSPEAGHPSAPEPGTQIIDLPAALRLADRANPEIGITRQAIEESLAVLQGAQVLLVPSIRGGTNYHDHNGSIQRSNGTIFNLPQEQSLFFGAGSRTVAAESVAFPGIRIFSHLGDAIFEPLAARQEVQARNFDCRRDVQHRVVERQHGLHRVDGSSGASGILLSLQARRR